MHQSTLCSASNAFLLCYNEKVCSLFSIEQEIENAHTVDGHRETIDSIILSNRWSNYKSRNDAMRGLACVLPIE